MFIHASELACLNLPTCLVCRCQTERNQVTDASQRTWNPFDCFSIVLRGQVWHSWWLYSYDVLPVAGYVWVCQREMPRRFLSRFLWHIHVRPIGLIRAHSPRSVNPLNPSYPSKSVFKKKLDAIMVCPIRSRSVVKMWGDNICIRFN